MKEYGRLWNFELEDGGMLKAELKRTSSQDLEDNSESRVHYGGMVEEVPKGSNYCNINPLLFGEESAYLLSLS